MLIMILSVVSFTKPGWDAHRLASGAEMQPGAVVDPLEEAMATKMGEVVFEAVPGLVIQLVAPPVRNRRSARKSGWVQFPAEGPPPTSVGGGFERI